MEHEPVQFMLRNYLNVEDNSLALGEFVLFGPEYIIMPNATDGVNGVAG